MGKKSVFLTLIAVILCCLVLISCSKQEPQLPEEPKTALQEPAKDEKSLQITALEAPFRTQYLSSDRLILVQGAAAQEEAVYLWGCNFQNETTEYWAVRYDPNNEPEEFSLPVSEHGAVMAVDAVQDEVYYLERADFADGTAAWSLHGPDGTVGLNWATADNDLRHVAVAGDTFYVADGVQLHLCRLNDGEHIRTIQIGEQISSLVKAKDGQVYAYCMGAAALYFDVGEETGAAGILLLPELFHNRTIVSGMNSDYDFVVIGESTLYGWNVDDAKAAAILNFDTCGLPSNNLSALICLEGHTFLGATWRTGDPEDRLFRLSPGDAAQETEEKNLRIAGLSRPMVMSTAISDFKALHPEYTVEYIDYSELYGDQAWQRVQIDLMHGDVPDLLFVNGLPSEAFAKRGLIEDLYPWVDGDEDLHREDFTENLLAALESPDQKLYMIPQSYTIVTTVGTEALAGKKESWSFSDINQAMVEDPSLLAAFPGADKEMCLQMMDMHVLHTLVDYENAVSHFDSPEALDFLAFLNSIKPHQELPYEAENEWEALLNGEGMFVEYTIYSADAFAETDRMAEGLVCPGYPGAAGGSFYLNLPMAIPAAAAEKEGAWEFLKMLITSDYYVTRGGWLPLQRDFDADLQNITAAESREKLAEIQKHICYVSYYDKPITNIVRDETSYMFSGVHTPEETAALIHSRVQLYLSEQQVETE